MALTCDVFAALLAHPRGNTVARHDREESLEEQLAWLDAIKETGGGRLVAVE